jgi:peptidoglycan/xylan/chitin deacetylase (PgdA/CDA1 family)
VRGIVFTILKSFGALKLLNRYKRKKNLTTVLCFHRVNYEIDPFFPSINPDVFHELLKYINDHFAVIHPSDIGKNIKTSKPKLVITFDDGYKDFICHALPVLEEFKMPCLHSIVYGCADKNNQIWTQRFWNTIKAYSRSDNDILSFSAYDKEYALSKDVDQLIKAFHPLFVLLLNTPKQERELFLQDFENKLQVIPDIESMMTWDDIQVCMAKGVEVASHTMTHDSLVSTTDRKELWFELNQSRIAISEKIGNEVNHFVFPNGENSSELRKMVYEAGYKYMHLLDDQLYDTTTQSNEISRISVYHTSLLENIFRVESFHNFVKSPYRRFFK